MEVMIRPTKLSGTIHAIPSNDEAHIKLICAAFSCGTVRNVIFTEDVCATLDNLKQLGAAFDVVSDKVIFRSFHPNPRPVFNCGESFKTMIYFMCICATSTADMVATFNCSNSMPIEAVSKTAEILRSHGVKSDFNGVYPFTLRGRLGSGEFSLPFGCPVETAVGLLLALNRNCTDSFIAFSGDDPTAIELAVDILKESKILTASADNIYIIRGGQEYKLFDTTVGGNFALAANYIVANFMNSNVRVSGLDAMSMQPEKAIFEILRNVQASGCQAFELDCRKILRLVPILAAYACTLKGTTRLKNVKGGSYDDFVDPELICNAINSLGGKAKCFTDYIEITGAKSLAGGTADAKLQHRLVYALAILSTHCVDTVTIKNIECIAKPYASFFQDFRRVGGNATVQ